MLNCKSPVFLRDKQFSVPCGRCRHCRIQRSREWAVRSVHEGSLYDENVFVTLTYDDAHLPDGAELDRLEMRRFFKNLRRELPRSQPIKYLAAGEYGTDKSKTQRPHYHALIFNMDYLQQHHLENAWQGKGIVDVGTLTYDSARYVADYIQKDNRPSKYDGRQPPFRLQSQGLGKQWCMDNAELLREKLCCYLFGVPVGLPLRYRYWLDIDKETWHERAKQREEAVWRHYISKYGHDVPAIHKAMREHRAQHDKNLGAYHATIIKRGVIDGAEPPWYGDTTAPERMLW